MKEDDFNEKEKSDRVKKQGSYPFMFFKKISMYPDVPFLHKLD